MKTQLKSETTTSKKSMREMETALAESTARSQKSEREYITLRESLKGLVQSFKTDHERLREEMRKREERMRKEAEEVAKKYRRLAEEVKKQREVDGGGLGEAVKLKEESERVRKEMETRIEAKVEVLREEVGKATKHNEDAVNTAKCVCMLFNIGVVLIVVAQKLIRRAGSHASPHAHERICCQLELGTFYTRTRLVSRSASTSMNTTLFWCSFDLSTLVHDYVFFSPPASHLGLRLTGTHTNAIRTYPSIRYLHIDPASCIIHY